MCIQRYWCHTIYGARTLHRYEIWDNNVMRNDDNYGNVH